jgi:predicted  nucleic acid-binding Zn-ribbon protein
MTTAKEIRAHLKKLEKRHDVLSEKLEALEFKIEKVESRIKQYKQRLLDTPEVQEELKAELESIKGYWRNPSIKDRIDELKTQIITVEK